ncbi:calcium uniporter protein 2, mitochondrial-like [Nymphaea colorata]|nr:calcium uniporter protein 2, mitochondrial-like [Nymphaea colorata]
MATARRVLRHLLDGANRAAAPRLHPRFGIPATCSSDIAGGCSGNRSAGSTNSAGKINCRRFCQSATLPETFLFGDRLIPNFGVLSIKNRLHFEGLAPPLPRVTVEDARKLLQVAQMEALKSRVRSMPEDRISYDEFLRLCEECVGGSNLERARDLAKAMDNSGSVIVLGETVFLRPDQVARVLEEAVMAGEPYRAEDPRRKELEELEREKAEIDERAVAGVRRELWCGLAYLAVQTAAFVRLTFWELSWDVMEPICFYVTSFYFMAGYTFFLRTSRDPSFEGFFASRFEAKQRRLMRRRNFDVARFHHLRRALRSPTSSHHAPHFHDSQPHSLLDGPIRH